MHQPSHVIVSLLRFLNILMTIKQDNSPKAAQSNKQN